MFCYFSDLVKFISTTVRSVENERLILLSFSFTHILMCLVVLPTFTVGLCKRGVCARCLPESFPQSWKEFFSSPRPLADQIFCLQIEPKDKSVSSLFQFWKSIGPPILFLIQWNSNLSTFPQKLSHTVKQNKKRAKNKGGRAITSDNSRGVSPVTFPNVKHPFMF